MPGYLTFTSNGLPIKPNDVDDTESLLNKSEDRKTTSFVARNSILTVVLVVILIVGVSIFGSSSSSTNTAVGTINQSINAPTSSSTKPNFVFIIADDLGYGSVGYDEYDLAGLTPFMTSLMKQGIYLNNYYAQEECTPSRASLLTGRYPSSMGMQFYLVEPDFEWGLNTTEVLLPQILGRAGYKSYGIGKWHLGHYSPDLLPTARGFDEYFGYTSGQIYYWSKKVLDDEDYKDLLYMNKSCLSTYTKPDVDQYSTNLFVNKALKVIENHDYSANPMFLYLSFQAVHDPFSDIDSFTDGVPSSYLPPGFYDEQHAAMVGESRFQYAISLYLLDQAFKKVYDKAVEVGIADNTYFIFTSDNGGCYQAGGRNGDLRGTKATLYEGGIRVDSFIYSALIEESKRGTNYTGLTHISDWFPTVIELANVQYNAPASNRVDGYSIAQSMVGEVDAPRDHILQGLYYNIERKSDWNLSYGAPFAIRNTQYKLLHTYSDNSMCSWFTFDEERVDDDNLNGGSCSSNFAIKGTYTKFLFDLVKDPYERYNIYDDPDVANDKEQLYQLVEKYADRSKACIYPENSAANAKTAWKAAGYYIYPWVTGDSLSSCVPETLFD